MRILHVTDSYFPQLGGIEMHVSDLAARQRADGHEVRVLTCTSGEMKTSLGGVPITRMNINPLGIGTKWAIADLIVAEHIDVVHCHLSVGSPLAWAALRTGAHIARVATLHSVLPAIPRTMRMGLALAGIPLDNTLFTAVSQVAARPLEAAVPGLAVDILSNGIDVERWRTPFVAHADDEFRVVSVGRFVRRKRPYALIEMLAELRDSLPTSMHLRADLIGAGPLLAGVGREVRRIGLADDVRFHGALSRPEIQGVLAAADVYVAPARLESFGIAALEARCVGLPVVAMACSGVGEFVCDGVEGFLVANDTAMVTAVRQLALDPVLLREVRRHNASTEPTMAWPALLRRHEQLYERAGLQVGRSASFSV